MIVGKIEKLKKLTASMLMFLIVFTGGCGTQTKKESVKDNVVSAAEQNKKPAADKPPVNAEVNTDKSTQKPVGKLIYNDESIPVLMYHSIMYEKGNELRMPKEQFHEQMKYLKDNGYTTLSFDELYEFLANNKPIPEKSIVITLDDGYVDNYTNAYPVLKEFGFKAAVFDITGTVDSESSYLTSVQMKEMEANGIQIEGHTVHHDELNKLPYDSQLKTLKDSKQFLNNCLNKETKYLAYPFGKYNDSTIKAAKEAGYKMAFTTEGGWANKSNGIMTIKRVYISSAASMDEFKYRITHPNYNKK